MKGMTFKYGIHTPQMTTDFIYGLRYLFEDDIVVTDISYRNDECDSVMISDKEDNDLFEIYLPNAIIETRNVNMFTHYSIRHVDLGNFVVIDGTESMTVNQVCDYISDYIFTNLTTCRNGKLMKDCKCC
jgi:hypothetical protein